VLQVSFEDDDPAFKDELEAKFKTMIGMMVPLKAMLDLYSGVEESMPTLDSAAGLAMPTEAYTPPTSTSCAHNEGAGKLTLWKVISETVGAAGTEGASAEGASSADTTVASEEELHGFSCLTRMLSHSLLDCNRNLAILCELIAAGSELSLEARDFDKLSALLDILDVCKNLQLDQLSDNAFSNAVGVIVKAVDDLLDDNYQLFVEALKSNHYDVAQKYLEELHRAVKLSPYMVQNIYSLGHIYTVKTKYSLHAFVTLVFFLPLSSLWPFTGRENHEIIQRENGHRVQ
jgi:hypothetical protein